MNQLIDQRDPIGLLAELKRKLIYLCYGCKERITDVVLWMEDESRIEYPFHENCSGQQWPLSEVSRIPVETNFKREQA